MEGQNLAGSPSSSVLDERSSSSIADDLFGRKDAAPPAKSSTGIFDTAFPATATSVSGSDSTRFELLGSSRKQEDGVSHWSPSKEPNLPEKDAPLGETVDIWTSIYYGGQDIYPSNTSSLNSGNVSLQKKDDRDDPENANMASRGNWWQGSLYY